MSLFKRLFCRFFRAPPPPPDPDMVDAEWAPVDWAEQQRHFTLDEHMQATLANLAAQERRPVAEVAHDLLEEALDRRQAAEENLRPWWELTARQREIAALVCSGFTNQEIAQRLKISPETVKTHIRQVLARFDVHSKAELQRRLANWDFSRFL
jgi:DNA-binding CsgD family transcriptional regulator